MPSLAHFENINFIGREGSNFEKGRVEIWGQSGKGPFYQKHPDFPNFLWMTGHFISAIFCILDLTNSSREIW